MNGAFDNFTADDVRALIAEYPLAWVTPYAASSVVGAAADDAARNVPPVPASLLPLLGEYAADGTLIALVGHMGRRNPLHTSAHDGRCAVTILFTGPHAYVSPTEAQRRNWAPTWNYAHLTIAADLTFLPEETAPAVDALVDAMEGGAWTNSELGERHAVLLRPIIGFRAEVRSLAGRFKLGQDEPREVFASICCNHRDAALVRWMRRFDR